MSQKKKAVKPGIYRILRWSDAKQRWLEPKINKYEAELKILVDGKEKRIFRPFKTVKDAELARAVSIEAKPEVSKGMLWKDFLHVWKANGLPNRGIATQNKILSLLKHMEFFDGMEVQKITPTVIDEWIVWLKRPEYLFGQKSTRTSYLCEYKCLRLPLVYYSSRINHAYKLPFLREHMKNLEVRRPAQKPAKDLSIDELKTFLAKLKDDVEGTKHEPIYYLAHAQYCLYARVQEAAALEFEDIDFVSGKVTISKRVVYPRFKGQLPFVCNGLKASEKKTITSKEATKTLREWCLKSGVRNGRIFEIDGQIITYRMIQFRYDRALKNAGIKFRGTHILRHASLTEHYATGKDIQQTKEVAGHSDLSTTQIYAKVRESDLNQTQALMDEKLGGVR